MSSTTEINSAIAATMTFAEGRALDDCTGGIDKHAHAEAKKQEKQQKQAAAAAKKAAKDAEKQRKAEAKAAKDAEKQRKAEAKAAKDAEKQRKAEEKEAEKQRKLEEKVAKAEAIANKKAEKQRKADEKEAEKQRKLHEKAEKAEAAAAKKAEREVMKAERETTKTERETTKAERETTKTELTSSPEIQIGEIEPATTQVETLQNPVTDEQAAEVSEIAINTTETPIHATEHATEHAWTTVHPPPELAERTEPVPSALVKSVSIDAKYEMMEKPHTPPELIGNTYEASEEEPNTAPLVIEGETEINTTIQTDEELVEDEWDKEIYGNETDAQKIVRLRKEANDLIRRARELEKSLPTGVSAVVEKDNDSDMREIEGVWYHVDTDGMLYNRSDELVGFVEKDGDVTFTPGWNSTRGIWEYETNE